jgi:RNA polymerase sigma-70 factor (ECF subfamily)
MTSPTSNNLSIEKLRAGDRQEFSQLVETFSAPIYRLALNMLADENEAEDVLQQTFLKAYRAMPNFEGRSSLNTWLYRIAMNESLMTIRKRTKAEQELPSDDPGDEEDFHPRQLEDWCCLPEEEFLSTESKRVMKSAVDQLSTALRQVFVLRDIEGLSVRDTAETLNISEEAVKVRLLRARLKLREILAEYFVEKVRERQPK